MPFRDSAPAFLRVSSDAKPSQSSRWEEEKHRGFCRAVLRRKGEKYIGEVGRRLVFFGLSCFGRPQLFWLYKRKRGKLFFYVVVSMKFGGSCFLFDSENK
ncbi:hypothetical protein KP509_14G009200 [Ceratopteris richardii]|uniref:Uncharacterized protein n=1 Tax=Ceratopteris richardii TaxID=49495 RepID=A0A8T2T9C7_CERRI|nr:hypothetical protein KP509_14G009200 [Ceratopteris richardii]